MIVGYLCLERNIQNQSGFLCHEEIAYTLGHGFLGYSTINNRTKYE